MTLYNLFVVFRFDLITIRHRCELSPFRLCLIRIHLCWTYKMLPPPPPPSKFLHPPQIFTLPFECWLVDRSNQRIPRGLPWEVGKGTRWSLVYLLGSTTDSVSFRVRFLVLSPIYLYKRMKIQLLASCCNLYRRFLKLFQHVLNVSFQNIAIDLLLYRVLRRIIVLKQVRPSPPDLKHSQPE